MSRRKSAEAKAAQRSGARAEAVVDRACSHYEAKGRAFIVRRPTPLRVLGTGAGGVVRARWCEPAGVDRSGVVEGGRAVSFDVKASSGASLRLEHRPGEPCVRPSQIRELSRVYGLGGLAGLVVRVRPRVAGRPEDRWFWLSWPAWLQAEADAQVAGRRSVGLELLNEHGVRCDTILGAPLWLDAALQAEADA